MKKVFLIIISIVLVFCFIGCSKKKNLFAQSDNEIFTYDKIDYSKTQIVVSRVGNIRFVENINEFVKNNPDIQVIYTDITGGGSGCAPWMDYVINGDAPDVILSTTFDIELASKYYEDLSGKDYTNKYYISSLEDYNVDGCIYGLPGPSELTAIAYNKTLFTERNWSVPKTFDEFVKLCVQITNETKDPITGIPSVEAYNPNGKYVVQFMEGLVAFAYSQIISGINNRTWYNDFINGKNNAKFNGHMEPLYEMINQLIENNIIREEHFTYSATKRGVEFKNGNIAMINVTTNSSFVSDEYEFGWFAFPGLNENENHISSTKSYVMSIPKKERTEKQKEAVERFVAYMSTEQGQNTYSSGKLLVSNLKDISLGSSFDDDFQKVITSGRVYGKMQFGNGTYITTEYSGYPNEIMFNQIKDMVKTGKTRDPNELTEEFDKTLKSGMDITPSTKYEIIATASEDFTILETSNLIADIFKEKAGADIALVLNNAIYRGNVMKYYKGDINEPTVNYTAFRSLDNNTTLMKADVTGEQLLKILNNPYNSESIVNEIYAFSGLKATINPWNVNGEKILSVTLADGTPIDSSKTYTICYWEGTVNNEYITSSPISIEGSFSSILIAKFKELKTLTPSKDKRITLVWD